jgi:putative lipoprotein
MNADYRLAALAAFFLIAGCAEEGTSHDEAPAEAAESADSMKPDVTLTNTYWKLVELDGGAVEPGEDRELHMTLRGDDQVSGYAGCNQFTGSVTVSGDGIAFGPIASTRRMCANAMQQEGAFLQALENAARYAIEGEDLAIENAGGEVTMRFVAVYME